MGRKIHPLAFRLGVIEEWRSRWFHNTKYREYLREDYLIRDFLFRKFRKMGLERVDIERSANQITIILFTSRPGLIIGRGGGGIEALKGELEKKYQLWRLDKKSKVNIRLQVEEVLKPESHAQIVAQQAAEQIEKRIPFRRVMKQTLDKTTQDKKEVKGAKIRLSGRLNGAEIARTEWLSRGRMPLATLRAKIDFGQANAYCTYGVIGIKVWIYKGEVFKGLPQKSKP